MAKKTPEPAYHHGNLRAALIEATLRALDHDDAGKLSLRAIAATVGVSVAAVYRHFPNKEALLAEVALDGFNRLNSLWEEELNSSAAKGPVTRFQRLGRIYVDFALASPAHFRLMFSQADLRDVPALRIAAERCGGYVNQVARETVTAAGVDEKWVLPLADAAWSIVHGYVHLSLERLLSHSTGAADLQPELVTHFLALPAEAFDKAAAKSGKRKRS